MIFYLNLDGSMTRQDADRVFQGSNKAHKIVVLTPFGNSCNLNIAFTLPNGTATVYQPMFRETTYQPSDEHPDILVSAWSYTLTNNVTTDRGEVGVSILVQTFEGADTDVISDETSFTSSFNVEYSVLPRPIPEPPTDSTAWKELNTLLTQYYNELVAVNEGTAQDLANHIANKNNPHEVKANQVNINAINGMTATHVQGALEETHTDVVQNTGDIADHETRIAANESAVADYGTRISTNETNISTNTTDISNIKTKATGSVTKDLQDQINTKQHTLTAGANINIENNVISASVGVKLLKVTELPTTGVENTIYLVPKASATNNVYDEYIYVDNSWEIIGSTDIDLTQYARTDQANTFNGNQSIVGDLSATHSIKKNGHEVLTDEQVLNEHGTSTTDVYSQGQTNIEIVKAQEYPINQRLDMSRFISPTTVDGITITRVEDNKNLFHITGRFTGQVGSLSGGVISQIGWDDNIFSEQYSLDIFYNSHILIGSESQPTVPESVSISLTSGLNDYVSLVFIGGQYTGGTFSYKIEGLHNDIDYDFYANLGIYNLTDLYGSGHESLDTTEIEKIIKPDIAYPIGWSIAKGVYATQADIDRLDGLIDSLDSTKADATSLTQTNNKLDGVVNVMAQSIDLPNGYSADMFMPLNHPTSMHIMGAVQNATEVPTTEKSGSLELIVNTNDNFTQIWHPNGLAEIWIRNHTVDGFAAEWTQVGAGGGGDNKPIPLQYWGVPSDWSYFRYDFDAETSVTMPVEAGSYIDFGDGTIVESATGDTQHTYAIGSYICSVKGTITAKTFTSNKLIYAQIGKTNVTNMGGMFGSCSKLTTIPLLDTSKVTYMGSMFQNCSKLTTIPLLDTSKVTNMGGMFQSCSKLTTIPLLDTSKVTYMGSMFNSCSKLTTIPLLDTSNVTNMGDMFQSCSKLTTIPLLDTSNVTNMGYMFYSCSKLTTIPLLDTSKVTYMGDMFQSCSKLTTIPLLDTSKVTYMGGMFGSCSNLTTIPLLDTSNVTNMGYMFYSCSKLEEIHMLNIGCNLDISVSTLFTRDALNEIIGNLKSVTETRTLTMGSTNLAKLTDEDKAVATNKGWTLA